MTLTTEEMGEVPDVDAARLSDVLASDAFGKFAVLSVSEEAFIQAGNEWQPGEACRAFIAANDSDPWWLEYREGGRLFRAAGRVTLRQIRQAFRSYLAGGQAWRSGFTWGELKL